MIGYPGYSGNSLLKAGIGINQDMLPVFWGLLLAAAVAWGNQELSGEEVMKTTAELSCSFCSGTMKRPMMSSSFAYARGCAISYLYSYSVLQVA
jgi:hypothetical protein